MSTLSGTTSKSQWPFTPQSIPGCQLWLDAADLRTLFQNTAGTTPVTAAAQQVQFWADKSGNGRNATSSDTAMTYNTTGISNPSISFSGSQTTGFQVNVPVTDSTYFFVVNNASPFNDVRVYNSHNGTSHLKQNWWYNTYRTQVDFSGIPGLQGPTNTSGVTLIMTRQDTSSTGLMAAWQTGTSIGTSTASAVVGETFTSFVLGTDNGGSAFPMIGYIAETIVYNNVLSTSQRQQVEGYLAQKWGLQSNLPGTHPYYATSSTQLYKQPIFQRTFSPVDITGCQLWLDASDATTITGTTSVSAWKDKSGNGANATNTGTTITISTLNGLPAINYDGSSYLTAPITSGVADPFSIFMIFSQAAYGAPVYSTSTSTDGNALFLNYGGTTDLLEGNGSWISKNPSTIGNNQTYLLSIVSTSVNGGTITLYVNGASYLSGTTIGAFTWTSFLIGKRSIPGYSETLSGKFGEIMVFKSALSSSQRQQVESYLAWKWGLISPLAPGHPGKTLPAFSTVFSPKSISGISLWLDAADQQSITLSTSTVTTWADKSGNGYNATGGVSPTYSSNGVQFNGSSYLTTSAPAGNNSATYFIVFKPSSIGFTVLLGGNVVSTATLFVGSSTSFVLGDWNSNVATFTTSFSAGTTYIASGMASGGVLSVSINAGTMATGSRTFSGSGTFTIGAGYTDNRAKYSGAINEVIVFNSALSVSDRQKVEGYLASKWGVQANLPSTHGFKNIKP